MSARSKRPVASLGVGLALTLAACSHTGSTPTAEPPPPVTFDFVNGQAEPAWWTEVSATSEVVGEQQRQVISIPADVLFATGRAALDPAAVAMLRTLLADIDARFVLRAEITGHADARGEAGDNDRLAANRAESVAAVLVNAGVDLERVSSRGAGEHEPVCTDQPPRAQCHAANRRVEIVLVVGRGS